MRHLLPFLLACLLAGLAPFLPRSAPDAAAAPPFPGWPVAAGLPAGSREEPLDPAEARVLASFPGRMGRFRAQGSDLVLAWVHGPTRLLHPADDCYRGLGYTIEPLALRKDPDGKLWSVRRVTRGAERLLVRERIEAADGTSFSDVSSWYWSALMGSSPGPWWHWRIAEPDRSDIPVAPPTLPAASS